MSANKNSEDEFEITPQMIEAGRIALIESGILPIGGELGCEGSVAVDIFKAMKAAERSS